MANEMGTNSGFNGNNGRRTAQPQRSSIFPQRATSRNELLLSKSLRVEVSPYRAQVELHEFKLLPLIVKLLVACAVRREPDAQHLETFVGDFQFVQGLVSFAAGKLQLRRRWFGVSFSMREVGGSSLRADWDVEFVEPLDCLCCPSPQTGRGLLCCLSSDYQG